MPTRTSARAGSSPAAGRRSPGPAGRRPGPAAHHAGGFLETAGAGNPTLHILALLAVSIGLPYFVLSATGPLLQQWFSRSQPEVSPYRLYALSNVGSLLALLSYPFYFETHFTRHTQAALWAGGLAVYAVACGFCAVRLWKIRRPRPKGRRKSELRRPNCGGWCGWR